MFGFGKKRRPSSNALFVIHPYLDRGVWVFDDPDRGLLKEPFVMGVPEMIERATRGLLEPEKGFVAVFSAHPFPGATLELERVRKEHEGWWYRWTGTGQEGWLCPALFRYFDSAPPKIHVQVKARQG